MTEPSATKEWRKSWPVVLAAFIGISFASLPMTSITFFIDPIGTEFGWSRTQVSAGISVFALVVIPFAPFTGAIQDWLGVRRVAVTGVTLCIAAMISLGLTTGSLELWIGQWAIFSLAEMLIKATVWLAAISAVFVYSRGLAIAVALCGTMMAQTVAPLVTYQLIEHFGWRSAYVMLAVGWGGATLLLVLLFFHDRRGRETVQATPEAPQQPLEGLTIAEALRCVPLYRIAIALMISSAISTAVITQKVPLLGEMGVPRSTAAEITAATGFAGVIGQLATGWLYDRSRSTWIGVSAFGVVALGFLVLLLDPAHDLTLIVIALFIFGYSSGAVFQAGMYLYAQYVGMRNFGKIFGVKSSIMAVGLGLGPLLGAMIHDHFGTYRPLFTIGLLAGLVSALLLFRLGPYPAWAAAGRSAATSH